MPKQPTNEPANPMDHDEQMILTLLNAIEEEPNTTQKDLATRLGVAVGLVNSYLKRVIYKGYVKTKNLERRRLRYLLTPRGIKEKTRLTYEFLEYSYLFIRDVRAKVNRALQPCLKNKQKRVWFYGSGEVAELAYLSVREQGMTLAGIVDPTRAGKRCIDFEILDESGLSEAKPSDVLLVLAGPNDKTIKQSDMDALAKQHHMHCVMALS